MKWQLPASERRETRLYEIEARVHGELQWIGSYESREDADRVLWAIQLGNIQYDRHLQRLSRVSWPAWLMYAPAVYQMLTTTFLTTTGAQTWTIPSDCSGISGLSGEFIDALGAGGKGGSGGIFDDGGGAADVYGAGGGGGGFSRITSLVLTPGGSASYTVGVGTSTSTVGDTFFNAASLAASSVGAKGGGIGGSVTGSGSSGASNIGTTTSGGASGSGIGTSKFSGGNSTTSTYCGGGAAGLNGAGAASSGTTGGRGDNANGGTGGTSNNNGNIGTEYDASHGSGGGAGRVSTGIAGKTGGLYGGGGSAGLGGSPQNAGGNGAQGLIVVRYTAVTTHPFARVLFFG